MIDDLKIIKYKYGEKMMHLCRELFPTLLETPGLLSSLLLEKFSTSRLLYYDIIQNNKIDDFKNYIYSLTDVEKIEKMHTDKTPKELLSLVGYDLYECASEEEIQSFRKYYAKGEELCTFTRGDRLDKCHVFFAIKKNVYEIKRENFNKPQREDEYGTSVISIQFTRGGVNTLSIKNRYNHTVENPDATFSNNLENIIPGLTESFEREYNLRINQEDGKFELSRHVIASDRKYYKYNYEINNIYYGPNNIIIDNFKVKRYDPSKYLVIDYFIIDLENKTIQVYDEKIKDSFLDGLKNIEKIDIVKSKDTGNKQIEITLKTKNKVIIDIDETNRIIGYKNNELTQIGDKFLSYNRTMENLELLNLRKVGNAFLYGNQNLESINLPCLMEAGDHFLFRNKKINNIQLNNLMYVGNYFLWKNEKLMDLSFPNLKVIGDNFLSYNRIIDKISFPNLIKVGKAFLHYNQNIVIIYFPNLEEIGDGFLQYNSNLINAFIPKLNRNQEDYQVVENKIK